MQSMNNNKLKLTSAIRTLDALSPLKLMERGYTIPYKDGEVVKSIQQVKAGDELTVTMQDGTVEATVTKTIPTTKGEHTNG